MHCVAAAATPTSAVPLPQPATGRDELFNALREWVEKRQGPERIEPAAASGSLSLPLCAHPKKPVLRFVGLLLFVGCAIAQTVFVLKRINGASAMGLCRG